MKHSEFEIGRHFWTGAGEFICTDTGTRVIVAVKKYDFDIGWLKHPPYDIPEYVLDENDLPGCTLTEAEQVEG
jgi:hypothetical protein